MTKDKILCSISTKGRYCTTLPLAINSVINQTHKIDKLIIFDDNDSPKDLREDQIYSNIFHMLSMKGIEWELRFAGRKGQHYNHQQANLMEYDWVWRVDDDNVAEPNVLEQLLKYTTPKIGAVGGSVIVPNWGIIDTTNSTGSINNIDNEPNIQWGKIAKKKFVDHLHCSFLYRPRICDYNLGLSKVAHREETLFTFGLKQKGYKLLVVPNCVTWHLKYDKGGIRSDDTKELYEHDENIFRNILKYKDNTIVILNCGMGDHIVFKHVLPHIKNPLVFSCYNDIVPGRPISEAESLFGNIENYNIYFKMDMWNWKGSLEDAFRRLYL